MEWDKLKVMGEDKRLWATRNDSGSQRTWDKYFWPAFEAVLCRLCSQNFFYEVGQFLSCDGGTWHNSDKMEHRLQEFIPGLKWPPAHPPHPSIQLSLVEAFYQIISVPSDWGYEDGFQFPIEFDKGKAHYDYTIEVNILFSRFQAPFKLSKGIVKRTLSNPISEVLYENAQSEDQKLNNLVQRGWEAFQDPKNDRRIEAAEIMVKAFEHLKSINGGDLKGSVKQLLDEITTNENARKKLDTAWLGLTEIGHIALRHSSSDEPSIDDPELAQYLFILYYSTISYALKKLATTN